MNCKSHGRILQLQQTGEFMVCLEIYATVLRSYLLVNPLILLGDPDKYSIHHVQDCKSQPRGLTLRKHSSEWHGKNPCHQVTRNDRRGRKLKTIRWPGHGKGRVYTRPNEHWLLAVFVCCCSSGFNSVSVLIPNVVCECGVAQVFFWRCPLPKHPKRVNN